jgi:dTDP-4-amino-4,6-dideoxygalactose transaminase
MDCFHDHIPLMKPWFDDDERQGVVEVLNSGWITVGPKVAAFEQQIAALVGAKHGVATNSATTALHLALLVSGLRPGDRVIVPAHTCMATANAIIMAGGVPVFADIDPRTYNLDPEAAEAAITDDIRGILLVHQIGLPADVDAFKTLAARYGLILVEDAATAFGARYKGRYLGGHGTCTGYSFHPRKIITTGEGGMLMLENEETAERARRLRSAGAHISDLVRHQARGTLQQCYPEPGYNYRLTDLQAAVGLAQLRKLAQILEQRATQAAYFCRGLAEIDEILTPYVPREMTHCWSSYCVTLPQANSGTITAVLDYLAGKGVSCRRGIQPLYREPCFAESHARMYLPHTEAAAEQTLFLPIFPGLQQEQQDRIIRALKEAVYHLVRKAKCA